MNKISEDYPFVFVDPKSVELFNLAIKVAKADIPVLITGPSGVGKEVLARVIHESSQRSDKPFIAINCAAIPDNLVEDTLFGHERGAFTGANSISKGFFEEANNGTIFLDEIGEMPINLQSKLLRVLQEQEIYRVGATKPIPINTRIISATNINIADSIKQKNFREDLYFRLSGFVLEILNLASRREDIEPLARVFIQKHSNGEKVELTKLAVDKLYFHNWPGNVRELENTIFRSFILKEKNVIDHNHIIFDKLTSSDASVSSSIISHALNSTSNFSEKLLRNSNNSELCNILTALQKSENREQAARELGMSTRTLRLKLKNFRDEGYEVPRSYARKI